MIFDLLHYMIEKMRPSFEALLADFIRIQTDSFSAQEMQEGFSFLGVNFTIEEIESYLDINPSVFSLQSGLYLTRAGAFTGAPFTIKPSAKEIEGGYLIVGHRCIPFVDSDQPSGIIRFSFDNEVLPHKVMEFQLRDVLPHFALFGKEYAMQFILSDPAARDTVLRSFDEELPHTVWLTVTDCSALFRDWNFKRGDLLLAEVANWRASVVKIRPLCNHKENPFEQQPVDLQRLEWYKSFEKRLLESFGIYGPGGTIEEQLAHVFFVYKNELCKEVSGTIEDAIKRSKLVGMEPYGVESRLWFKGQNVPAVGPWLAPHDKIEEKDSTVWSNEQVDTEMVLWPRVVFDSWIMDGLYQKENNEDFLIKLILGETTTFDKLKKKRLQGTIRTRRTTLESTYNWFADFDRGPVRHRLLDLHTKVFALILELDDVDDQLEGFPQQPLVILTQLSTHIQYMLEGLLRDQSLGEDDIRSMEASLGGMEYNFEDISAELKDALTDCYKHRFSVINHKDGKGGG